MATKAKTTRLKKVKNAARSAKKSTVTLFQDPVATAQRDTLVLEVFNNYVRTQE